MSKTFIQCICLRYTVLFLLLYTPTDGIIFNLSIKNILLISVFHDYNLYNGWCYIDCLLKTIYYNIINLIFNCIRISVL